MLLAIRLPRPFCEPPKYSETNAVITDAGAAILSAVNRYGTALGTRTFRSTAASPAAYERISSRCTRSTSLRPRATLTSTMKYTMTATINRRGTSLVTGYMLLNTETSTKIGTAFSAIASGVIRSFRSRNRARRKLVATPIRAPRISPTSALSPDTLVASQIKAVFVVNALQIADGVGRKYGWKSKTFTASSHRPRNAIPNTTGGHTRPNTCPGDRLIVPRRPARCRARRRLVGRHGAPPGPRSPWRRRRRSPAYPRRVRARVRRRSRR